jgi:lipoyl(octanoyl) transferase
MNSFRLIRSGACSAAENMVLDEKIFKRYLEDGVGCLRLYQWKNPAFTCGFSQEPEKLLDLKLCAQEGVGVAKRITGGGLLFHDDEITYSFVCSKTDIAEPAAVFVDYRNICTFLLRFYGALGLPASFALETVGFSIKSAPHELCSAAYEKYDIVIAGKKIGGNAQKRNRQAIFQHGAIPLRINWDLACRCVKSWPDNLTDGVTTLSSQLSVLPEKNLLEEKLIEAFSSVFNVDFVPQGQWEYEAGMVK